MDPRRRRILVLGLLLALGVGVVPALIPTGPDAGFDAAGLLEGGRFLVGAAVVFLGGLLTSLTPCVYPLIPITVSVFGARKAESRLQALLLTTSYVVGMGVVFSALGVAAALGGKAFGSALSNPWVVLGLGVFLLVLATSMFGAFELALPSGMATRLSQVRGGGVLGALLMGSVSGFLAAPCTGPVLTGVLTFVAKSQNVPLGATLLFLYALGVGVPFFLIGVFTVRLPKSGEWMEWVKSIFGVALVALALSYAKDALPALKTALAAPMVELGRLPGVGVSVVLTALGVLLGAVHLSFKNGRKEAVLKLAGVSLMVLAVLWRTAADAAPATGQLWVRLGVTPPPVESHEFAWHVQFPAGPFASRDAFDAALAKAKAEGRPVMIDFFAEWCAACKELDRDVYPTTDVRAEAQRFFTIKVDGTNEDEVVDALYKQFGVQGLPTIAFVSSEGQVLSDPRITGFLPPERFLKEMRKVR